MKDSGRLVGMTAREPDATWGFTARFGAKHGTVRGSAFRLLSPGVVPK
jgi:hypothetical protein